ncbi:MAG: hypothetical protein NVSMB25_02990 [Thermoleophilaceae bacterium]
MTGVARAAGFYDRAYASADLRAWRELGARGKADHVAELIAALRLSPARVVEVGCGDGSLLAELGRRGIGERLTGFEISATALELARAREIPNLALLERFDGRGLDVSSESFDLAVLSHVLEHVDQPAGLLREAARCARVVVVEVPLESNLSARRQAKRSQADSIGHLQRLDRRQVRALVRSAGLEIAAELLDPLPLAVHEFFSSSRSERGRAAVKAALRRALFTLSERASERLFTLHYACACVPASA